MRTVTYPSDLTREQWEIIKPLLPVSRRGRPRRVNPLRVVNAILYLHHTGCQWDYLPKSYPNCKTVYYYFSRWSREGVWEKVCHRLHELVRQRSSKFIYPRMGIIDAQSVRSARGEQRAFDGFKRVMGRKRNILVDALGIVMGCLVHSANQSETMTGKKILDHLPKEMDDHLEIIIAKEMDDHLEIIIADKGYRGALESYAEYYHGIQVDIVDRKTQGTNLRPWRWIVERTFAWLNHYRRLSRDYEHKVRNSESMLYISMLPILLHRLAA